MGFLYRGSMITLRNYMSIFANVSPDIQDEVRSAAIDDTEIGEYIAPCVNDSYKLGQIRIALREGIPKDFITTAFSGYALHRIRGGLRQGYDMTPLLRYVSNSTKYISDATMNTLADFVLLGADITRVDFTEVAPELVEPVCRGLSKGYPMWVITESGTTFTEDTLNLLMRGLSLGIDIHPFLNGEWSDAAIITVLSYVKTVDVSCLLSYINAKFPTGLIKEVFELSSKGFDVRQVCIKDREGYPIYDEYQVHEIGILLQKGICKEELFDPMFSAKEISELG